MLAHRRPPFRQRIRMTMRHADDCYVSVDVSYVRIGEQAGRISAILRG
jgi:hypothetical protein